AELVGYLSGEGMSIRAIAEVIGVDRQTVANDQKARGENSPPDNDRKVTSKDGKTYQRKPKPQPDPPQPETEPAEQAQPPGDGYIDDLMAVFAQAFAPNRLEGFDSSRSAKVIDTMKETIKKL